MITNDCYSLAVCPFNASWRIVLEVRVAGSVLSNLSIPIQLARVAARTVWGVQGCGQPRIIGLIRGGYICAEGFAV